MNVTQNRKRVNPFFFGVWVMGCLLTTGPSWAESLFFLRIADVGRYTATIGDQNVTLSTGRYRFFDLPSGQVRLTISQNNIILYQGWVDLAVDSRTIAEFSQGQGFRLLGVSPLSKDGRFWDWDTQGGSSQRDMARSGRSDNSRTPMSVQAFDRVQEAVSNQTFDDGKYDLLVSALTSQYVSSAQLAELLKLFSFDEKRLEAAKRCWSQVSDQQNYYAVFDSFTFKDSINKLKSFLSTR